MNEFSNRLGALAHTVGKEYALTAPDDSAVLVRRAAAWGSEPWHTEVGPVQVIEGEPLSTESWRSHPALSSVRSVVHAAGFGKHAGDVGLFGRFQFAVRSTSGCERNVPLTSTSIFGIV